eukprot:scaffold524382_cov19-Prasinocladus_malaysianus.AAC.1
MASFCVARTSAFVGRPVAARPAVAGRPQAARSPVLAAATADRPMWLQGASAPKHLDGSLPGDFGFDPLGLGSEPDRLA